MTRTRSRLVSDNVDSARNNAKNVAFELDTANSKSKFNSPTAERHNNTVRNVAETNRLMHQESLASEGSITHLSSLGKLHIAKTLGSFAHR